MSGRLENARAFRAAARAAATLAEPRENANPLVSQIVSAAIAYADALTARYRARMNQKDRPGARKARWDALGNRLPKSQESRFARILEEKDAAQYGARRGRMATVTKLIETSLRCHRSDAKMNYPILPSLIFMREIDEPTDSSVSSAPFRGFR